MRTLVVVCALLCLACTMAGAALKLPFEVPPDTTRPPLTPSWAFGLWVWEDDVNTAAAVWDLVDGYPKHDIPITAAMIDSPWETLYNDFRWDTERYPNPQQMIDELHRRGLRLVLWMTNMVNLRDQQADASGRTTEDIYAYAKERGYLCNDGKPASWWKGVGGFPDYTNPEALAWWHGMMDRVLDMGIDGWKVDGSSAHFPFVGGFGKAGPLNVMQYSDQYYRDTYQHLVLRRPEGVTMVRSVDAAEIGYEGRVSPKDAAPVTWVGDQRHTWDELGILEALRDVFLAIPMGYPVIGSDTGGYQSNPAQPGMPKTLFLRWAQWNAFMPFFINGGHNEHRPWKFDPQTLDIFRRYAWLHQELAPFWYSGVARAHLGQAQFLGVLPGTWQYRLGDHLLVAPVYQDSTQRELAIPAGRWHYYWQPERTWAGPATVKLEVPLAEFPVLVRQGAIIPMQVSRPYTGAGDRWSANYTTLDIYPGASGEYDLYREPDLALTHLTTQGSLPGTVTVSIKGLPRPAPSANAKAPGLAKRAYLLRVLAPTAPKSVTLGGKPLAKLALAAWVKAPSGWRYDPAAHRLWVKVPSTSNGTVVIKG